MTGALPAEFTVAWSGSIGEHTLTILDVVGPDWLANTAALYRELRTATDEPIDENLFADLDIVNIDDVRARYLRTQIPQRAGGNFAVVRSDLAEVLMGYLGEQLHGYLYGYRSTRDRELIQITGRGIDQIGVSAIEDADGQPKFVLMLGEAKVSADQHTPPAVVDALDDSLRNQHLYHLADRDTLIAKVTSASRRARGHAFVVFQAVLALLESESLDQLHVHSASLLVRPLGLGAVTDFGSFKDTPDHFLPGRVDFVIVRTDSANIETTIDSFHAIASAPAGSISTEETP